MDGVTVRGATPADVGEVHAMMRELAVFEELSGSFEATVADLERHLFGDRPAAGALVAEAAGVGLIGYAVHFPTFSSFAGRPGLWLEDLYVRPEWRGRGAGRALLDAVVDVARERGCGRCEWSVLDWNRRAIGFYESVGGRILGDWRIVRLDRAALERLTRDRD